MFTYEQRMHAVKLLIQYNMRYSTVVRELGYPKDAQTLKAWYREYKRTGDLKQIYSKR